MTAALRESSSRREQSSSLKSMRLGLLRAFARGDVVGDDDATANAARMKEIDEAGSHPVAVQIGSPKSVPCI
jgi:hypothetical protein